MSHLPATFAALGDTTRFAIVERLLSGGELPAGRLLDIGNISAPAISRHLKILREAGVVERRIDKQRRLYSVRPEAVQAITAWTMSYRDFWQGSLDRLEAAMNRDGSNP
ncbi:metalloregulator ArsR/SmtB family transcription factor [Roseovarius sp. Pro17]|uniref:ArsR/SmtB family transcription factor n=1 Tax=Roseovarius sp. Pro17 TaxID=3108175 RepID=UPI002D7830B5|nr:metalloregulator ArsR/SmtB family transcription factor [Roseovarius sp. Pro17]